MNSKIQFSLFLLMSSSLLAFQDSDLDGVEDSLDLCPNTPFELLVNKNGCASSQNRNGKNSTSISDKQDLRVNVHSLSVVKIL